MVASNVSLDLKDELLASKGAVNKSELSFSQKEEVIVVPAKKGNNYSKSIALQLTFMFLQSLLFTIFDTWMVVNDENHTYKMGDW